MMQMMQTMQTMQMIVVLVLMTILLSNFWLKGMRRGEKSAGPPSAEMGSTLGGGPLQRTLVGDLGADGLQGAK